MSIDEAIRLKKAGRLDGAVIALEGVLSQSPDNPVALTHLADVQLKRGRPDDATAALDRAEAITGTTRFTAKVRGDLHFKARRWQEAARAYQDANALGDRTPWPLLQLARCHLRLNDLEGARGAAAQVLERDEKSAPAWTVLGDIARREDRLDDAETAFERARQHAPDDQWAYAKLVEVRILRLPPDKRVREIEVLMKSTGKGNTRLLGVLARLRRELGQDDVETWHQAARQSGTLFDRQQEGFALRRAGRLDEAAAVLGACLVEDPQDMVVYKTFVHLQHERGALDELRSILDRLAPRAGKLKGPMYGELRKLQST